jgi:hypothetical protein
MLKRLQKCAVQSGRGCTDSNSARQSYLILRRTTLPQTWIVLLLLPAAAFGVDFTFEIPPVPVGVDIGAQHLAISVSGKVSASPGAPGPGEQTFPLTLRADLGGLQSHLTPLVQQELNRSEKCGDRVSIQSATLAPAPALAAGAADLAVQLHYERWACVAAEGDAARKLLASDATVHVIVSPVLEKSAGKQHGVKIDAAIGGIEADGPLGEMLRSGAVGSTVRDKMSEALLKVLQRSTDLDGVLKPETRRFVAIQKIAFVDAGFGRLALDMTGRLQVPGESVSAVLEQFGNR